MYKISFKDKENKLTGEHGPLMFIDGKSETSNPWFAAWFEGNGFDVVKVEENKYAVLKVDELKAICDKKGIEYDSKIKRDDLLKLLEGVE